MTETPYNSVNDSRFNALTEWLNDNNFSYGSITVASADAGFRRYFRLHIDNYTLIAVDAPPEFEDTKAFVDVAKRLSTSGLRTPKIHCYSLEKGFLVVDDFGHRHLQHTIGSFSTGDDQIDLLYRDAMLKVIHMQKQTAATGLPAFDRAFIGSELELFPTWYLERHLGLTITDTQRTLINDTFEVLIKSATEQPHAFMHRDFHCRNLMLQEAQEIGIIDFQGALYGPVTYDPVSLLRDVYLVWPDEFQQPLIELHRKSLQPAVDKKTYQQWFDYMGLQRHLKILGIFCRLNYRDNKPNYLTSMQNVCDHVKNTVNRYAELAEFAAFFNAVAGHKST